MTSPTNPRSGARCTMRAMQPGAASRRFGTRSTHTPTLMIAWSRGRRFHLRRCTARELVTIFSGAIPYNGIRRKAMPHRSTGASSSLSTALLPSSVQAYAREFALRPRCRRQNPPERWHHVVAETCAVMFTLTTPTVSCVFLTRESIQGVPRLWS